MSQLGEHVVGFPWNVWGQCGRPLWRDSLCERRQSPPCVTRHATVTLPRDVMDGHLRIVYSTHILNKKLQHPSIHLIALQV